MNKWRMLLAVLLLIVVMFLLSFLITIMASRVIPPKEKKGTVGELVLEAPRLRASAWTLRFEA